MCRGEGLGAGQLVACYKFLADRGLQEQRESEMAAGVESQCVVSACAIMFVCIGAVQAVDRTRELFVATDYAVSVKSVVRLALCSEQT